MMSTTEGELDVEVSHELEDGELEDSDVEEGTYIPLTRPETFNPPSLVNMQIQDEQSDDDDTGVESSCSDSDDEFRRRPKRTKLRPKRPQPSAQPDKKEKYNVWCKALQEDLLTQDMVSCDVTKKGRYGVESYDYTIKYRLDDNYVSKKIFTNDHEYKQNKTNKRSYSDRSNKTFRQGKKINSEHPQEGKQKPRNLLDLTVTSEQPAEVVAEDIAEKLHEDKKQLLVRIVQVTGANKAMEIFKETQRIEADGGMLVMNGTRRRTSGGIFFFLLKRDNEISQAMINEIFNEDRLNTRKIKKTRSKNRQKVMEQLKQSLTDSELPSLLSRSEATVQSEHGSNPPPSPATDARDCSSDTDAQSHTELPPSPPRPQSPLPDRTETRNVQNYDDDDFLEVMCNEDMDLF